VNSMKNEKCEMENLLVAGYFMTTQPKMDRQE
jgi:hypothetical protein